jgi:hypothetical protein
VPGTPGSVKNVLKASSQAGQTKQEDGFKEVRSQNRHLTREAAGTKKKADLPTLTTKNFFTSLRTINMDTDAPVTVQLNRDSNYRTNGPAAPNNMMSAANLIQLQRQLKGMSASGSVIPGMGPG